MSEQSKKTKATKSTKSTKTTKGTKTTKNSIKKQTDSPKTTEKKAELNKQTQPPVLAAMINNSSTSTNTNVIKCLQENSYKANVKVNNTVDLHVLDADIFLEKLKLITCSIEEVERSLFNMTKQMRIMAQATATLKALYMEGDEYGRAEKTK